MHKTRIHILSALLGCACLLLASTGQADDTDDQQVVIASTNFTEQFILANIYAEVLEKQGIEVQKRLRLGPREVVFPALKSGELDIMPEYTGALLGYLTNGESKAKSEEKVLAELRQKLPADITALEPSPAQDKDGLAVTTETAKQYDLSTFSDLKPVGPKLVLGGPSVMKTRYVGLPGLKQVYGVEFKEFRALDSAGPLTQGALTNGDIDVARMYTTQGVIAARGWVLLQDDKGMIPAQNLIPVIRKEALTPVIQSALNAISDALSTNGLQQMNKRVTVDKVDPAQVAHQWVQQHDLEIAE